MLKPSRHWNALLHVSAVAVVFGTLVGCSAIVTSKAAVDPEDPAPSTETHSVPHTSNRAPDPKVDSPPGTQLSPSEASLSQIWAITKDNPLEDVQLDPRAWGMGDFFSAIATRCYPQLTADQISDLEARYGAFLSAQSKEPLVIADLRNTRRSYFDEATRLCM